MASDREGLKQSVKGRQADLAALTQALVRVPTVNPPGGGYRECVELVGRRLEASGFSLQYLRAVGTPGDSDECPRINLVARREGSVPGPTVHFNSHVDVVPAGEGWRMDPFAGQILGDRIFGRGACDMKGGLATSIVAVESFLENFPAFPGCIEISATADEETGGYGGVGWLAGQGVLASPRIDHVIIPEPLGSRRVCVGHRGCVWAEIETVGQIAHGCMPSLGDCAVRHMGEVLRAFERRLYPAMAGRVSSEQVIPAAARASSMNINAVHGGQADGAAGFLSSCVPDRCRLIVDRRFHAPETVESVLDELRTILRQTAAENGFRWKLRELWSIPPIRTPRNSPLVAALKDAIQDVHAVEAEEVLSPGTYDHKHFDCIGGIRDCVAYGPGVLEMAHQPNEYIEVGDMARTAMVMALALHGLLHMPPSPAPGNRPEKE